MNREIKFRAWNGLNMEYAAGCSKYGCFYSAPDSKDSACLLTTLYPKEVPLMQFTGLKDKNGKEIYESDILQIGAVGKFEVIWGQYDFGQFQAEEPEGSTMGWIAKEVDGVRRHILDPNYMKFNEVVGNIYEK